MGCEFSEVVIAFESDSGIFNWTIFGVGDRSRDGCDFVGGFVLTVSCSDAQRDERNVNGEHLNNAGEHGSHQELRFVTAWIRIYRRVRFSANVILTPIYGASWFNSVFA